MMRSLYSGVSGLRSHQTKMDVIGNNIANVNTIAYKSSSVSFSEVFYQTTQTASGSNAETGKGGQNAKQIGLGSTVGAISTAMDTEGASQRTDNPFDLKITGSSSSFFIVRSSGNTYFTRAGDFTVDDSGALVTQSGASVMGWSATDGVVNPDVVQPLYVKSPEYTYTDPEESTALQVTGNINSSSANFQVDSAGNQKGETMTLSFYDNLGYRYQAQISITQTDTDNYVGSIKAITKEGVATDLTATFDGAATFPITFAPGTGYQVDTAAPIEMQLVAGTNDNVDAFVTNSIMVDMTGIRCIGDATSFTYPSVPGNGKAVGKMSSVGISDVGEIIASYSNGDTLVIGQIATQSFSNPAGLEKVGTNMYAATLNSGEFDGVGEAINASGGKLAAGTIEMSNVDLSGEFTEMITTQRGFQANSRIITVSDTLLEELINLKR